MPEQDVTAVAAAATAAPVETKPAEVVADAAKTATAAEAKEEATLLGEGGEKKDGAAVAPEAKVVPEKYEIKAPEGMELDPQMVETFTPVFKKHGMTQEAAQELSDTLVPQITRLIENQQQAAVAEFNRMGEEWKSQTNKELSADGKDPKVEIAHAGKFLEKYGDAEARQVFNDTKVGNHPAIVRMIVKAGKAIANDSFPDSGKKGKSIETDADRAAVLFPSMKQQ